MCLVKHHDAGGIRDAGWGEAGMGQRLWDAVTASL